MNKTNIINLLAIIVLLEIIGLIIRTALFNPTIDSKGCKTIVDVTIYVRKDVQEDDIVDVVSPYCLKYDIAHTDNNN